MFCSHCGKPLADGARFCGNCGAQVAATVPPAAAGATPSNPTPAAAATPPSPPPATPAYMPGGASAGSAAPGSAIDAGAAANTRAVGASGSAGFGAPSPAGAPTFGASSPAGGPTFGASPPPGQPTFGSTPAGGSAFGGTPPPGALPPGGVPPAGSHVPGAFPTSGAAVNGLVERVKRILVSPNTEWPVIAAEPRTARDIYLGYVAPLAAIGVIASFIGTTTIGVTVPLLGTVRTGLVAGLAHAVLSYAMVFVAVFVVAMIVDALAPTFGGQKDPLRALKLVAYSYTAFLVASVVTIIPMLGILAVLGGLYGLYLLYLGLPVLMRNPPDKSIGYTLVVIVCTWVVMFILTLVVGGIVGMLGFGAAGLLSHGAANPDQGADVAAGIVSKMMGGGSTADQARMKDAISSLSKMGEQAEKAEKAARASGNDPGAAAANAVDMNAALNAVGTMMAGGKDVHPVDFHALKDLLPASLPGMTRGEASGQSGEAMGMKGSSATASYGDGTAGITIEIADLGSLSGLATLATRFDPKMEKETSTGYERTRTVSGQLVHERYDRQAKSGETNIMVGNRFSVTVRGHGVEAAQLTGALQAIDMARLPKLAEAK